MEFIKIIFKGIVTGKIFSKLFCVHTAWEVLFEFDDMILEQCAKCESFKEVIMDKNLPH